MGGRVNVSDLECEVTRDDDFVVGSDVENETGVDSHFHPYWELKVYERDGRSKVVMTPPETLHSETRSDLLASGWVLHCREPMLNLSFPGRREDSAEDVLLPWERADAMCPGGLMRLVEASARAAGDLRLLNHLLGVLWSVVHSVWRSSDGLRARPLSAVEMAEYYIDRNYYRSSLSVEEVASYAGVTPGYLANLFKKRGGRTVRERIVDTRMAHALRLLRSGDRTVAEVAEITGWSNQFYFSNRFKRRFGVPPSKAAELIDDDVSIANDL